LSDWNSRVPSSSCAINQKPVQIPKEFYQYAVFKDGIIYVNDGDKNAAFIALIDAFKRGKKEERPASISWADDDDLKLSSDLIPSSFPIPILLYHYKGKALDTSNEIKEAYRKALGDKFEKDYEKFFDEAFW
jgi:hypothetical protein